MSDTVHACCHCAKEFRLPIGLTPPKDSFGDPYCGACTEYLRGEGYEVKAATWR